MQDESEIIWDTPYLIAICAAGVGSIWYLLRPNNSCSEMKLYEASAKCAAYHIYSCLDILLDGLCCNPTVALGDKAFVPG